MVYQKSPVLVCTILREGYSIPLELKFQKKLMPYTSKESMSHSFSDVFGMPTALSREIVRNIHSSRQKNDLEGLFAIRG